MKSAMRWPAARNCSLLVVDGENLRLLFNIRAYAEERFSGDTSRWRRWAVAEGEKLLATCEGSAGILALQRFAAVWDDVRRAHDDAVRQDPADAVRLMAAIDVWLVERGSTAMQLERLNTTLALVVTGVDRALAQVYRARGDLLRLLGRGEAAKDDIDRGLTLAQAVGAPEVEARLWIALAMLRSDASDPEGARLAAAEAVLAARRAGDPRVEAMARSTWGLTYAERGVLAEAEEHFLQALELVGDGRFSGNVLTNLANVLIARGKSDEARPHLERALALYQRAGAVRRVAAIHLSLGFQAMSAGDPERAEHEMQASIAAYRGVGLEREAAIAVGNLGWLFADQGRLAEAGPLLIDALRLNEAAGTARNVGIAFGNLGVLRHLEGRLPDAVNVLREAVARVTAANDRRAAAWFLGHLAAALADGGEFASANQVLIEARHAAVGAGDPHLDRLFEIVGGHLGLPVDMAGWGDALAKSSNLRVAVRLWQRRQA